MSIILGNHLLMSCYHRLSEILADFSQKLEVRVVSDGLHHGLGSLLWVTTLEDA